MSPALDVLPAQVDFGDGTSVKRARVYVDEGGRARVFVADRRQVKVEREALAASWDKAPTRLRPVELHFEDGSTWTVRRLGGCGCQSPLKKFNPVGWTP
jgi:hypothetical protein